MNPFAKSKESASRDGRLGKHCLPPPVTTLKLQLNYSTVDLENHPKSS